MGKSAGCLHERARPKYCGTVRFGAQKLAAHCSQGWRQRTLWKCAWLDCLAKRCPGQYSTCSGSTVSDQPLPLLGGIQEQLQRLCAGLAVCRRLLASDSLRPGPFTLPSPPRVAPPAAPPVNACSVAFGRALPWKRYFISNFNFPGEGGGGGGLGRTPLVPEISENWARNALLQCRNRLFSINELSGKLIYNFCLR